MIRTSKTLHQAVSAAWLFLCWTLLLAGCGRGDNGADQNTPPPITVQSPELLPISLPLAFANTPYSTQLLGRYGTSPYTFYVDQGSLPDGLLLSSNGIVTGSATGKGTYAFHVTLSDSESPVRTATQSFAVTVSTPLQVSSQLSFQALRSTWFSAILLSGGTAPYKSEVLSGALPGGLTLNPDGTLTGTPDKAAPFTATLRWTDAVGQSAVFSIDIAVKAPPLTAAPVDPVLLHLGQTIAQPLSVQGGTPPYSFTITGGSLPSGVSLNPAGSLQGNATVGGNYSAVVSVSDGTIPQQTTSIPVSLSIATSSVQIDSSSILRTVSPVAYGVHTSVYDQSIGDVNGIAPMLITAGAKVLRFPGGSYSDRYHWAQHTLTPNFPLVGTSVCSTFWNGYLAPSSDFGNFVRLLQASHTTGIVTVNYGSSVADKNATRSTSWSGDNNCSEPNTGGQPEEAAAWVAYANGSPGNPQTIGIDEAGYGWKTVGFWASLRASQPLAQDDGFNFLRLGLAAPIGIRYWEIGNEIYYNGYNGILTETDLHAPFRYSNGDAADPDSRQGVSALSPDAYGYGAARFANAMHAVDPTIQVGLVVGSAIDPIPATWTPAVLQAGCSQGTFDFAILHYYPGAYNAVTTDQLLANPQQDLPGLVQGIQTQAGSICGTSRGPMPVFMTETNPNGMLASTTPDAAAGLFAAHDLLTAFEAGVNNAEWLELHAGAGTFLSASETPGPAFYGFQLAHLLADAGDQLVAVTSTSSNILVHAAKQKSGKISVMLLNRSTTDSAFLDVQGSKGALKNMVSYRYGLATSQSGPALTATPLANSNGAQVIAVTPLTAVVILADE